MGLSRHIIREYVKDWILDISDDTPLVRKMRKLCEAGEHARAKKLLPPARVYEAEPKTAKALGMTSQ